MAHKTFISYKYSESQDLRDDIITKLGADAAYYQGETSDSPDLTDTSTENIKRVLKDMLWDTTVTIVIISPHIKESKWIPWEIKYCLKMISRDGKTSRTNGLVGVVQKVNGSYDWFINRGINCHGQSIRSFYQNLLPEVLSDNIFNSEPPIWHCNLCKTYDFWYGGYMTIVEEDEFLSNPSLYIENAYEKMDKNVSNYRLPDLVNSDPRSV